MGKLLLVVGLLCSVPLAARAGTPDTPRAHFEAGTRAFNLGEFQRAIDEYKAGYNLKDDPVFLFNIGQAYRQLGDLQQALFFFRSYLRNAPRAPNRADVEERIRLLEEKAASAPPKPSPTAEPVVASPAPLPSPSVAAIVEPTPLLVASPAPRAAGTPVYKKWWLWAIVGGAVAVGLGLGLGFGLAPHPPSSTLGATAVF